MADQWVRVNFSQSRMQLGRRFGVKASEVSAATRGNSKMQVSGLAALEEFLF